MPLRELTTIGYQGASLEAFLGTLQAALTPSKETSR